MEIICFRKDQFFTFENGDRREIPLLIPAFQSEFDKMRKAKRGTQVLIDMELDRDLELFKHFRAVTNFVYDNLPENYQFQTIELFMEYVKIQVGFVEVMQANGVKKEYPRSMSFKYCSEEDFRKLLYHPAMELYSVILQLTREELIDASLEYSGIDYFSKRIT